MHETNSLRGVDLNLLVVLDALLAEQHVSRTATRLNMSQPAVSHALGRLRHLFDDPLLIRRGGKLIPSAKALEIAPTLTEALRQMQEVLEPAGFDAAREKRTFRLAMSDYGSSVILPGLLNVLRRDAPGIDVEIVHSSRDVMQGMVRDGECDLALGVFPKLPGKIEAQQLFVEHFACLADQAQLSGHDPRALEGYLARPHILVTMKDENISEIDAALAACGHTRRIAVTLPHWANATRLIAGADLILTVAHKALQHMDGNPAFAIFEPPFSIPSFSFVQIWHERRNGDPGHQWLRDVVASVAISLK